MAKYMTLFEGECERSIIEWLKPKGYKFGKLSKVVLSEIKNINRSLFMIDKKFILTVVLDTDTLFSGEANKNRLKQNILWLINHAKEVRLITQNKNLEDELMNALNISNQRLLFEHFNEKSIDKYKKTLATMVTERLEVKLSNLDFNVFWSTLLLDVLYNNDLITVVNFKLNQIK